MDNASCGYVNRPSDEPADELLLKLAKRIERTDEDFKPVEVFDKLKPEGKDLANYGIPTSQNHTS